jgi:hypothetical protein
MNQPFARLSGRFEEMALSLYLPAGPAPDRKFHHALIKDLEREWKEDAECGSAAQRELAVVKRFLDARSFAGRPLAIFSYEPRSIFEVRLLPEELGTILKFDHRFYVEPLRKLLRRHPPAVVAVVDKEHARVFEVVLGDCQEVAEFEGEPVKHHKQGGSHQASNQRHMENLAHSNLKAAVDWLAARTGPPAPLYVGGPTEARSSFIRLLPKRVRERVAGEFPAQLTIAPAELLEKMPA